MLQGVLTVDLEEEVSLLPCLTPTIPSILPPTRKVPSMPLGADDDPMTRWAISDGFPATQVPEDNFCDLPQLQRAEISTGSSGARSTQLLFDKMTWENTIHFCCFSINPCICH